MPTDQAAHIQAFITKWQLSGAAERANAQSFVIELCEILEVDKPEPKAEIEAENAYVFEKTVPSPTGTSNFIDCYKRGHFIFEAKQGADAEKVETFSLQGAEQAKGRKLGHGKRGTKGWDTAMQRAKTQAERYARGLPKEEIPDGRPPFLIVCDVGHQFEIYADWSRAGGHYEPFPDPASYRINIKDLVLSEVRELLRDIWTDPISLDPNRRSARVTREIADRLAKLARSLEGQYEPERVSNFLMRCLFTMFSEDVQLLPYNSFTVLLGNLKQAPQDFVPALQSLWESMNTGGYAAILQKSIPRFNGGLFAEGEALPLNEDQIQLLLEAATKDWKDVEPAIFGTLLERALDPRERHKLGAHYTPRAYVERLVQPTVMDPLREEWAAVQVAALQLAEDDKTEKAIKEVRAYLDRLAHIRVLDPACGSGNFLYVTLELLKRLEGEVLNMLNDLGYVQTKLELEDVMVTPANFLGIEVNPRAAAIADLVLWIGFLQWHLRTHGSLSSVPEPILRDHHNIECRDAVLDWDERLPMVDENGEPVTRWDGHTTKPHHVTGKEVPDPDAQVQAYSYTNPRQAEWPDADYIVGNPPFIGQARMRESLGDGYTEALRRSYKNVPDSADLVMFWWDKAAELTRSRKVRRFGFITTNSLRQTQNRKVLQYHMSQKRPISLVFAIPDHPWVDSADGAAVRISMTSGTAEMQLGVLNLVIEEFDAKGEEASHIIVEQQNGKIYSDLTIGADVASAVSLKASDKLSCPGVKLHGAGFILSENEARKLGFGQAIGAEAHIREYRNGKDLTARPRGVKVIDLFGLTSEQVRDRFPAIYQHVLEHVKPERDQNNRSTYRENWWIHGEPRKNFRPALKGLRRYISTIETSKHRFFLFLDEDVLPDNKLVNIALADAFSLGVLSSRIHVVWALATGSQLGPTPVYVKTIGFEAFPFPTASNAQQDKIGELAERLDAHRKRQLKEHPKLTMTNMYNVLEKEKAGETLTDKEREIHEQGLVGILRQIHEELDAAVADAYGWPADLIDDEILHRLVELNAERAAEEAQGHVRWLRPEYQAPEEVGQQTEIKIEKSTANKATSAPEQRPWPKELPEQAAALNEVLTTLAAPSDIAAIAAQFKGKKTAKRLADIERLLETLSALGRAEQKNGHWSGN